MTSLVERQPIIGNIEQACCSGAALHRACQIAGVITTAQSIQEISRKYTARK
jgi:hypothetical protein